MSYIRNPVYMFTGSTGQFEDDDTICVSLPRGEFRNNPDGADFRRIELLAAALVFLSRDYPEYLTLSGEDKLVSIENAATRDSFDKWEKKDKRILESLRGRSPEELSSLLKMSLNPDDWEVDMFEFGCQDDT
jgi:hypothetical protein